jgi:hypothetical protein
MSESSALLGDSLQVLDAVTSQWRVTAHQDDCWREGYGGGTKYVSEKSNKDSEMNWKKKWIF